jgi:hypothetical protein
LELLLRGIAKGEPTACRVHVLGLSRQQLHTLRQRIQTNLNDTAPTGIMVGTAFEADELYQNAGAKKHAPSRPLRSAPLACQSAQRARHLCQPSFPIMCVILRETDEHRLWVYDHADTRT